MLLGSAKYALLVPLAVVHHSDRDWFFFASTVDATPGRGKEMEMEKKEELLYPLSAIFCKEVQ